MIINIIHKKQTDQEMYENIKKLHKKYPNIFMNPDKWMRLRKLEKEKNKCQDG